MVIQSNDLFYTFEADGLALFSASGAPVSGTDGAGFTYPAASEVIRVTVTPIH